MIRAAGIMYLTPDNQTLFLQRGGDGDCVGQWCFPGGKIEDGETPEQAARREAAEEAGDVPDGSITLHSRSISPAEQPSPAAPPATDDAALLGASVAEPVALELVDFSTFIHAVDAPFAVTINDESTGYAWGSINAPPEPLHAGCRLAIERLTMDELGVARAMAAGRLTSPQRYLNVTLFAIRITGTGVAYRSALDEFVWRDPTIYLNDEFLARCAGLTVIMEHPGKNTLDSEEFANRAIGSVLLPYIKGDEVWGIAKVYDDAAVEIMSDPTEQVSTSPCVVFKDPSLTTKLQLENGSALLIEGKPSLLDHIAICPVGVWDKGGEPRGVINDSDCGDKAMADENDKTEDKADAARSDADHGVKLDKLLDGLTALTARVDSMDEKFSKADDDGKEKGEPKEVAADSKADAEEEAKAKADVDKESEEKAKADAEEEAKAKADAQAKADSDIRARIDGVEELVKTLTPRVLSDAEHHAMADAQARADSVFQAFGDAAPRPLAGEDINTYRRRLAKRLQGHSEKLKGVNLLAIQDSAAFDIFEEQIYSDAVAAAHRPVDLPHGQLREIVKQDRNTGLRTTTFVGNGTFIGAMKRPAARARLNLRREH